MTPSIFAKEQYFALCAECRLGFETGADHVRVRSLCVDKISSSNRQPGWVWGDIARAEGDS